MKTKFIRIGHAAVALALVIFVSSCSTSVDVAKRRYKSGYYVSIGSGKTTEAYVSKAKVTKAESIPAVSVTASPQIPEDVFLITSAVPATAAESIVNASAQKDNLNVLPKAETKRALIKGKDGKISLKDARTFIKELKKNSPDAKDAKGTKGGGKSQLVALLLCFFLGGLGIHRFYLGYIWQGVVQLLTGGGCGVWALIDFIRIILGTLEPKDGGYSSTL